MKKTDKQSVNITYCPNCGARVSVLYSFCPNCGSYIQQPGQGSFSAQNINQPQDNKKKIKAAKKTNPVLKANKGSFLSRLIKVIRNIAGILLTVLMAIFLFALTCEVILNIAGSDALSQQILAFLPESGRVSVFVFSPGALIAAGVICAAFIAADILLNLHEAFKFFLQLSIAFFSCGLLAMLFMLALSSRQLCLFTAAGEIFAGSILLLLYTIALSASKKKIRFLSDLPGTV